MKQRRTDILVLIVCVLFTIAHAEGTCQEAKSPPGKLQILVAPWVAADSDKGIGFGITAGIARPPGNAVYSILHLTSKGNIGVSIRGETSVWDWQCAGDISASRATRYLYPPNKDFPDFYAKALTTRYYFSLSILKPLVGGIEIGPDFLVDIARSKNVKDHDGNLLDSENYPRFGFGSVVQCGLRARWLTTSVQRPLDGWHVDASIRGGRASGDVIDGAQPDLAGDLRVAWTKPLHEQTRLYLRGWGRFQSVSPPPVRNYIGGDRSMRGQPAHRDFGRRFISGRAQINWDMISQWSTPFTVVNYFWSRIPRYRLDVEFVTFYDFGAVGDPDYGWRHTRHGYGAGLRFVLPPELVFFLDIARSPGGDVRFYLGGGETL